MPGLCVSVVLWGQHPVSLTLGFPVLSWSLLDVWRYFIRCGPSHSSRAVHPLMYYVVNYFLVRTRKGCSRSKFQMGNTFGLPVATTCPSGLRTYWSQNWGFVSFDQHPPMSPPAGPGKHGTAVSVGLKSWDSNISKSARYLHSHVWLISRSIIASRYIQVVENGRIST